MPSSSELHQLLGELLRTQPDRPIAEPMPDDERLREALTGRRPFDADERRLFLRSPTARARLNRLAEVIRAETYARWHRGGIAADIVYRAAAGGETKPISVTSNPDFALTLFPLHPEGGAWSLHLRLSPRAFEALSVGVRLIDSDGAVWLEGRPDRDGELSGDWRLSESPLERLREFRLRVEPC